MTLRAYTRLCDTGTDYEVWQLIDGFDSWRTGSCVFRRASCPELGYIFLARGISAEDAMRPAAPQIAYRKLVPILTPHDLQRRRERGVGRAVRILLASPVISKTVA